MSTQFASLSFKNKMFLINIPLEFLVIALFICFSSAIILPTQHGPVEGIIKTTELGTIYYSFQGIPYARPFEGHLRFRDPQPPTPWNDPLNCTVEGPPAFGKNLDTSKIQGSFDSLHVNVFTNNINPDSPYPVIVWIHGSAYHISSSTTAINGPDYLMERNVTVVTLNHRLGPFGFLSLDDPTLNVPGNAGMKDQRMALQWVQNNIANFGGDPKKVTLAGFSAGGGSAQYHMLSENSRGLFHQAISMGGVALKNDVNFISRNNWAQRLAVQMGFNSTNEKEILSFLENADPFEVISGQLSLGVYYSFGPTSEPFVTDGLFLSGDIEELAQNAWGNSISYIIGQTSMEKLEFIENIQNSLVSQEEFVAFADFENYIPRELRIEKNSEKSKKYAEMIRKVYYPVFAPTFTNVDPLMFLFSDNDLWFPTQRTVRYRLRAGNVAPTYIYRFDALTDNLRSRSRNGDWIKFYRYSAHGDDMGHLMKHDFHKPIKEMSPEGYKVIQIMVNSFVNFAATGDPSIPELNITWRPVTSEKELLFGLNIREDKSEMMVLPETDRMGVFQEIWDLERGK